MQTLLFLIGLILIIRAGNAVLVDECTTSVKVSRIGSNQYRYSCGWLGWWKCTGTRYFIEYTTLEICCEGYQKIDGKCLRPEGYCGVATINSDADTFIVGGSDAIAGEYPWLVSLRSSYHSCGGTIISDRWVLTAAHCVESWVDPDYRTRYVLRFGEQDKTIIDRHEITMAIETFVKHEDYDSDTIANDIALIKTIQPIVFNDYARPACLPSPDLTLPVNTSVDIAGWGIIDGGPHFDNRTRPTILQKARVFVADLADCIIFKVVDKQICVKDGADNTETQVCNGDSGGPLMLQEDDVISVVGVASFVSSAGCATGRPAVFTNVAKYIDWIQNVMANN